MHVLVVCPPFGGIGGLESVAEHLARQLVAGGHMVTVIARGEGWSDTPGPPWRRLEAPLHQFPRRSRHLAHAIRFVREFVPISARLLRAVRAAESPDVVLSLAPPNYAPYSLVLARRLGRPLVAGLHQDPAHLERHANGQLYRLLLRRAASLVACSERVAAAAVAAVPACRPRLTVIPNGYDPAEFAAAAPRQAARPFLLAVARLVPEKGLDVLIEAFALIASDFPALDLLIAGDGPEAGRLATLVAARGLDGRVCLPGFADRRTTVGRLLACELVCCPSRWESFSLVALEAAAAGKAVVAAAAGALPELVRDGETGVLVRDHEPAAWASALRPLLADPARAAALGQRARSRVGDYAWDRIGARYVGLLEQVRAAA